MPKVWAFSSSGVLFGSLGGQTFLYLIKESAVNGFGVWSNLKDMRDKGIVNFKLVE